MKADLKGLVRYAAKKRGITGVMALVEHCGMDYRKVVRVWNGDKGCKLSQAEDILNSLGYKLKAVPQND
ncbi:MAG: hypothetical protein GY951_01975 [Psychromonas sp.]|nr:hypothetical protein [Psychromonas sp.]